MGARLVLVAALTGALLVVVNAFPNPAFWATNGPLGLVMAPAVGALVGAVFSLVWLSWVEAWRDWRAGRYRRLADQKPRWRWTRHLTLGAVVGTASVLASFPLDSIAVALLAPPCGVILGTIWGSAIEEMVARGRPSATIRLGQLLYVHEAEAIVTAGGGAIGLVAGLLRPSPSPIGFAVGTLLGLMVASIGRLLWDILDPLNSPLAHLLGSRSELSVSVVPEAVVPGSTITGSIRLSRSRDERVRDLQVDLVRRIRCPTRYGLEPGPESVDLQDVIASGRLLVPDDEAPIPFVFRVPSDIPPSTASSRVRIDWRLRVTARVAGRLDLVRSASIGVLAPRPVQAKPLGAEIPQVAATSSMRMDIAERVVPLGGQIVGSVRGIRDGPSHHDGSTRLEVSIVAREEVLLGLGEEWDSVMASIVVGPRSLADGGTAWPFRLDIPADGSPSSKVARIASVSWLVRADLAGTQEQVAMADLAVFNADAEGRRLGIARSMADDRPVAFAWRLLFVGVIVLLIAFGPRAIAPGSERRTPVPQFGPPITFPPLPSFPAPMTFPGLGSMRPAAATPSVASFRPDASQP